MSKDGKNAIRLQRQPNPEAGYSIIELVIVTLLIFIISAMAVIQLQPAWQQIQANAALDQVKTTLRQARETAISQRRTIAVGFPAAAPATSCLPNGNVSYCITLTQMVVTPGVPPAPPTQAPAAGGPFLIIPLENNVTFLSYTGEPDTPDAFIGGPPTVPTALYDGAAAGVPPGGLQFQSDGTFTNSAATPVNFTIFLGEKNIPTTARAVTILGNTGKVTGYQGIGTAWLQ